MSRGQAGGPAERPHAPGIAGHDGDGHHDGDGRLPAFRVDTVPEGDRTHVRPVGEIDIATAPTLEAAIRRVAATGSRHIVVDLREVTFMDAAGARVLVEARERTARHGDRLSLVPGPRPARRPLELTGAISAFELLDA